MSEPPVKVPDGWIRNESDVRAVANGCRFDEERGKFVCDWIEKYLKLYEGEWAGEPLILMPWARDVVMRLFGWVRWSDKWKRWIRRFRQASIWVPKKNGKALALDTPIPTPDGWKAMGDLQEGDIVFSEEGKPCRVLKAHPVTLDEETYEVSFSNGEKIVCNGEHLWLTTVLQQTVGCGGRGKSFGGNQWTGSLQTKFSSKGVRTTKEIAESLLRPDGARNHSVWLQRPLQLPKADLPIPPYVLGCWLGDGDSDCARITCHPDDFETYKREFSKDDYSIAHESRNSTGAVRFRFQRRQSEKPARTILKEESLFKNKHIPAAYLRASFAQRLSLLQGLMDTDGCIDKPGKCMTYTTKLAGLHHNVCELLSSLGVKHRTKVRCPVISGRIRTYYTIQFHAFCDDLKVFRLPRKLERMRYSSMLTMQARSRTVQITDVRKVAPALVRCITVDNPTGMFLCGRTMLPTHNSPLLAALGLFLLCGDGEQGGKVFFGAKDGKQAREIAGEHSVRMMEQSPELKKVCSVNRSTYRISHYPTRSYLEPLSSSNARTQESKEGINGSVLIDEVHVVDRDFVRRISRAGISRSEPLQIEVSTAGNNPDSYGQERFNYGREVEKGTVTDEQLFVAIYAAPQDLTDEQLEVDPLKYGRMANPAMGHTVDPEEYLKDYERSKRSIQDLLDFKMYRLNIWQRTSNPWLKEGDWLACKEDFTEDDLRGQECWAGLDLSRTRDMSALVLVFRGSGDEEYRILSYFWMPEARAREIASLCPVLSWKADRQIELTPGGVTDYGYIRTRFRELARKFNIQELAYDPRFAEETTQALSEGVTDASGKLIEEGTGVPRVLFPQNDQSFAAPTEDFERLVIAGKLKHNGQPVLTWQVGHAHVVRRISRVKRVCKPDESGYRTVDGVVAGIMALGRASLVAPSGSVEVW